MPRVFILAALALAAVLAVGSPARAAPIRYATLLNGANEVPPNASLGTGYANVDYDPVAHTLRVQTAFGGLTGLTTASHIHSATALPFVGTAGVATTTPTFPGFPLGVTSGFYDQTFDLTQASSWNPAFITANGSIAGAEAAFANGLATNRNYLNVHSSFAPGGEIRGFLVLQTPEPTSLLLFAGAVTAAVGARRFRARRV